MPAHVVAIKNISSGSRNNKNIRLIIFLLLAGLFSTTIYGIYEFYGSDRTEMEAYKCDNPNCQKIHYRPIVSQAENN